MPQVKPAIAFVLLLAGACGNGWSQPLPQPSTADQRALPAPRRTGGPELATVLAMRRSTRTFGARAVDDAELGQLLWSAQGIAGTGRTAPSAGALYPLTIRVVDATGIWRYVPTDHVVVRETTGDQRGALAGATFQQVSVGIAPATLVISAQPAITARKYGDRAERYATLEAGHAAQNVLLAATALGLGAVPIGGFDDASVRRVVGLSPDVLPLYLIPVGSLPSP